MALLGWEARAARRGIEPLLDPALLATPAYGLGLLAAFVSNGVTIGLFVLVPFWLARGWHVGSGTVGLVFLPVALGLGSLAPVAGKRSDVSGARNLTTGGMAVGAVASALLVWLAGDLRWPFLLLAMFALGASSGLFAAPNNNAILQPVPDDRLAAASSMLSTARTLGVILGVSATGALFDLLSTMHGANGAAGILFFIAALLYAVNAALCWIVRGAARQQPALAPSVSRPGRHKAPESPGRGQKLTTHETWATRVNSR
jgi:DHA2 family multidrug resistance protein-like MFS transporter